MKEQAGFLKNVHLFKKAKNNFEKMLLSFDCDNFILKIGMAYFNDIISCLKQCIVQVDHVNYGNIMVTSHFSAST